MKISELIEMAAFTKQELGMGMSELSNASFVLSGGFRSGSSSAGTTRLKYVIYDKKIFQKLMDDGQSNEEAAGGAEIGEVELFVEDETGEIVGLVNIEFKENARQKGYGRQIIQDIKDTTKSGFTVDDIQREARGFWEKMGINYSTRLKRRGRIEK